MAWAPDYVTAPELKSYLRIEDNADDVFIGLWITTASRNVDDYCGRQFGGVPAEERTYSRSVYDAELRRWVTRIDDLQSVANLVVTVDGTATTDYTLEPENGPSRGKPYERILTAARGPVALSGEPWGWAAVPSSVKVGMLLQAARLSIRRDSPFGIAGSPSDGSEVRLLAQLDPDFKTSLRPFRRRWWAA